MTISISIPIYQFIYFITLNEYGQVFRVHSAIRCCYPNYSIFLLTNEVICFNTGRYSYQENKSVILCLKSPTRSAVLVDIESSLILGTFDFAEISSMNFII